MITRLPISESVFGPDDRLENLAPSWDGESSLDPHIYCWGRLHYARTSVVQEVIDETIFQIPEIFVCPQRSDCFLVYSPLVGEAGLVNGDTVRILGLLRTQYPNPWLATFAPEQYRYILEFLRRNTYLLQPKSRFIHRPRMYRGRVDLCLTSACNLNCTYCFAGAGQRPRFMKWEVAKTALDLTVQRALKDGRQEIEVAFQGDGEEFVAWPMMRKCTDYIRDLTQRHDLGLRIWAITNGYLNAEMVQWVVRNLDSLAISLDGPPDIHDAQRPTRSGKGSSSRVIETIRRIDQLGGTYSLRATITRASVTRMKEIVAYVIENFAGARSLLVLDPLFPSYVSVQTGWEPPSADDFAEGYLEAQQIADEAGLRLGYTGFNLHEVTGYHCDAWGVKLAVTPEGLVTSCPLVATMEDERSGFCVYGRYVNGLFEYDWSKLRRIMARNLKNLPQCANCMVRWHCAGECYARLMMVAGHNEPLRSFRCEINRRLFPNELNRTLTHTDMLTSQHET